MKILLLGASGQVGLELSRVLPRLGVLFSCNRGQVDFSKIDSLRHVLSLYQPDCIVNAVAYTDVDAAENNEHEAFSVNAEGLKVISEEAFKRNAWLIHYSTDYVFDGRKSSSYREIDLPNPLNIYGQSKLAGEKIIQDSACKYIIFRTSWVVSTHGQNFLKSIINLAQERDHLNIVNDQKGAPTTASFIAEITSKVIDKIKTKPLSSGIYHLSLRGETTWFDLAKYIIQCSEECGLGLNLDSDSVFPISTEHFSAIAKRPLNSLLSTRKLERQLDYNFPHWKGEVDSVIKEIIKGLISK
tara:strand:+ start:271 stop:1167 length:897 start_codon:yes stop_codon:yes gene_type:complete